jgi:hypothetical protein
MADREQFKKIIKMMESSGGKNMNHKRIEKGSTEGQTAGGAYGMVPSTITDVVNQLHNRKIEVDPRLEQLSELAQTNPDAVTKVLNKNRDIDELAADHMTTLLENKTGGDINKMAYAWNMGHNRDFSKLDEKKLNKSDYFRKFARLNKPDTNILDQEKFKQRREEPQIAEVEPFDSDRYSAPVESPEVSLPISLPKSKEVEQKVKQPEVAPTRMADEDFRLNTVGNSQYADLAEDARQGKFAALRKYFGQ